MAHKAPGKYFRSGLSLVELMRMFPDDAAAERWFTESRWPDGVCCPHCGSVNVQSGTAHKTMPYRCRDCRKFFSAKTGTVLQSSKLGYQVWALATYILTTGIKGTSSMKLHRDLGITQKSAWHLAHRIRETWEQDALPFSGPVEVDETFIGGKGKEQAFKQEAPRWARTGRKDGRGRYQGSHDQARSRLRRREPRKPTRSRASCLRARTRARWSTRMGKRAT